MSARTLTGADVASLRQFVLMAAFSPSRPIPADDQLNQKTEKWLGDWQDELGVAVEREGRLAGAAWARHTDLVVKHTLTGERLLEVIVSVLPEHRGQRLGIELMQALQRLAVKRGIPGLCLQVSEKNPAAIRVYGNAGFNTHVDRTDTGLLMMSWEPQTR